MTDLRPNPHGAVQRKGEYARHRRTEGAALDQMEDRSAFPEPEVRMPYSSLEERARILSEAQIKDRPEGTKREIDVLRSVLLPSNGKSNIELARLMAMKNLLEYVFLPDMIIAYDPDGKNEDLNAFAVLKQFRAAGKDILRHELDCPFNEEEQVKYSMSKYFAAFIPLGGTGVVRLRQELEEGRAKGFVTCAGAVIPYEIVKEKLETSLTFVRDLLP